MASGGPPAMSTPGPDLGPTGLQRLLTQLLRALWWLPCTPRQMGPSPAGAVLFPRVFGGKGFLSDWQGEMERDCSLIGFI